MERSNPLSLRRELPPDFLQAWEGFGERLREVRTLVEGWRTPSESDEVRVLEHWWRLSTPRRSTAARFES